MAQQLELGGYQVVGRIAVGGMAEVYQARALQGTQKSAGEPDEIVLKRLLPSYRSDGGYVKQFVDEAKLTVRLRHPNIVRTYRCFKAGLDYLMVQELVTGRPLSYMQDLLIKGGTPMPASAATYIVYSVVKALDYIHRAKLTESGGAIVHRDVNPANILLSMTGEVKLTDFGVADADGISRGEAGALRGTLPYMSPEQVMGLGVDTRSDLYSAGMVYWELLANKKLRPGQSEMELMHQGRDGKAPLLYGNPEVPDYAAQIVRKSLMADRKQRFQTAAEFQKAIEVLAMRNAWPLTPDALKPLLGG